MKALAEELGKLLLEKGLTLSTAESCTGGGIASVITSISGSSEYFKGGIVAYANEVKTALLGVSETTLEKHGAVSEETVQEMAKELGMPHEDVVFALEAIQDPVSLFEPVYNDGGDAIYIMDQVKDEKTADNDWIEKIAIKDALQHLNDREKRILRMRFFEGRTQMEVAGEIGISQAQVSRLEKNALIHMRKYVSAQ